MNDASNILKGGMEMQKGQPDSAEVEANIKQVGSHRRNEEKQAPLRMGMRERLIGGCVGRSQDSGSLCPPYASR